MSRVKVFVEKVLDMCDFGDTNEVFVEWFVGYLVRGGYGFRVDDERGGGVVVFEVWPRRSRGGFDVFEFVVNEGWYVAHAAYLIGAYVEVSVCDVEEVNCVNLYLNDIRKMERDELPIVGP